MQRAMPYCLEHALPNNLCVFRSRVAVRPIHATTHRHHTTSRRDSIPYTCHLSFGNPRHDRSCVTGRHSTTCGLLPLCLSHRNPSRSCPAAERHECRAGHAPRRLRHVTTQRTTPHERRRRQSCRRPPPPHCACHTELVAARRQLTLAHPPLRMPSAAGSHTATLPRRHAATPPPCDQGQARRQYVST